MRQRNLDASLDQRAQRPGQRALYLVVGCTGVRLLGIQTAALLGADALVVLATRALLKAAKQAGWGEEQHTTVAKLSR